MNGRTARPNPSSQPLFQQSSGPYSRILSDTFDRYVDPQRRPPANSLGSYHDGVPSEKHNHFQEQSRQEPSDQKKWLKPIQLKQEDFPEFVFGNLVAVSPLDYHPSQVNSDLYVMLKNLYVCTAKTHDRIGKRQIGIPKIPREWAGISRLDPPIEVEEYDPFQESGPRFLGSVKAEASFTSKMNMTETLYDQDELQEYFTKV